MKELDLQEQLSDYIDNNMSDEEKKNFEQILSNNEDLNKDVDNIKKLLSDIKQLDTLELPNSFDNRLKQSINEYDNKKSTSFNIFHLFDNPIYASIGSIAAIALLVMITFMSKTGSADILGTPTEKDQEIIVDSHDSNIKNNFEDSLILQQVDYSEDFEDN